MRTFIKILVYILPIVFTFPILAQISNESPYNLYVRTTGYRYDPDNQNGTNYITFLLDANPDNDHECLVDTEDGSGYSDAVTFNYDTPETRTDAIYYRVLMNVKGISPVRYNFTYYTYQDNCDPRLEYEGDCCGFLCLGKEDVGLRYTCRNVSYRTLFTTGQNGTWYKAWRYDDEIAPWDSKRTAVRLEHTWRHHHGDGHFKPLRFNDISYNTPKSHINRSNGAVASADPDMGYKNNWKPTQHPAFNNGVDVTYSFNQVNSGSAAIKISTVFSETDFDTRLHLLEKNGDNWVYITSNSDLGAADNRAEINMVLPHGEYFVVVEADQIEEGKFKLEIESTEVNCDNFTFGGTYPGNPIFSVQSATLDNLSVRGSQNLRFNVQEFIDIPASSQSSQVISGSQLEINLQPCIDD